MSKIHVIYSVDEPVFHKFFLDSMAEFKKKRKELLDDGMTFDVQFNRDPIELLKEQNSEILNLLNIIGWMFAHSSLEGFDLKGDLKEEDKEFLRNLGVSFE